MAIIQAAAEADTAVIAVKTLVIAMKERLDVLPKQTTSSQNKQLEPYTLSRVPAYVRKTNDKFYDPMVIAIGPYHHGCLHLQAMEKHKWRYLRNFLDRSTCEDILDKCLKKMEVLEEKARLCYSESINLTSDEFVEMMLLDACFILELAFKLYKKERTNLGWGFDYLHLDLLSLENQIPFFVIQMLFDLVIGTPKSSNPPFVIEELILYLYSMASTFKENCPSPLPKPSTEIHHLLHLCHHWFVASTKLSTDTKSYIIPPATEPLPKSCVIPCATELRQAGVRFKKKEVLSHLLDITFQKGVMEIPVFSIDDTTKPLFTNLIAFEQSACSGQRKMTSYCALMDCLVNTEKDVEILQRCDVIENLLGSEEEVACFFNQLCEYAAYEENHYFSEMFKQVNRYRNSKWHKHRARLCHDYFSNPWAFLSLAAAIVLLILTFLQTFFALYAYFRPPKSSS